MSYLIEYLAGFCDAEGCIYFYRNAEDKLELALMIKLLNNREDLREEVSDMFSD